MEGKSDHLTLHVGIHFPTHFPVCVAGDGPLAHLFLCSVGETFSLLGCSWR